LFETCTPQELNEILDIFEPVNYMKGEKVIEQGENGNTFYVVERGELTVEVAPEGGGTKGDVVNVVVVRTISFVCGKVATNPRSVCVLA
jgi:CRP-like cAMP-binding protein